MPNFFLEAKAPKGGTDIAKRQVTHDLAVGARTMHSLQNYSEDTPVYDDNAYAYSGTYHAGTSTLQLYSTHITAPIAPRGRPEYYMTQLDSYRMTGKLKNFVEGARAFRNLRDLAGKHRNNFITTANANPTSQDVQELSFQPLQSLANYAPSQDINKEPLIPQCIYPGSDDQEDRSQASVPYNAKEPTSFATSFTSSLTSGNDTNKASSKRHRVSQSPPSSSHPKKYRHAARTHQNKSRKKDNRSKKNQSASYRKGKGKSSPPDDAGEGLGRKRDDEIAAYKQ